MSGLRVVLNLDCAPLVSVTGRTFAVGLSYIGRWPNGWERDWNGDWSLTFCGWSLWRMRMTAPQTVGERGAW